MKPLSVEEKQRILESHPSAAPGEIEADIAEYERLVARMFQRDPDAATASSVESDAPSSPTRLTELHQKLFGH